MLVIIIWQFHAYYIIIMYHLPMINYKYGTGRWLQRVSASTEVMSVTMTCAIWRLVAAPQRRRRHELVAAQINENNNLKIKWKYLYIYIYIHLCIYKCASPSESTAPTVCARVQTRSTTTPSTTTTTTTTAHRTTAVPSRRSVAHKTPK